MKKYIIAAIVLLLVSLLGTIAYQRKVIEKERIEKETYQSNTRILLDSVKVYKTKDSLNVASVGVLGLKLSEYKTYRADDYKTIQSLKIDVKRLQSVVTTSTHTIHKLQGVARDTTFLQARINELENIKSIPVKAKHIKDNTEWYSINMLVFEDNTYSGEFINREKLIIVNHIVPKKFLFFKWGVKEVKNDVVSKNKNTVIESVESSVFRK